RNVMRDNHLVNISGHPGRFMPVDLNTEHLIGYLKRLFAAKGIYSMWDHLGNISPAIVKVENVKKHFAKMMNTSWKNRTHKDADTRTLIWRLANKIGELGIQEYRPNRLVDFAPVAPDLIQSGWMKLKSSAIPAFNKKITALGEAGIYEEDKDDLPTMQWEQAEHVQEDENEDI
ncbi:hypothetical protein DFJ43DRAFT_997148, partial [Lentinula guzmanii]